MKKVLVLSTSGCTPCAIVKKMLGRIAEDLPIEVEEINVMGKPELLEKYRFAAMPGIVIDGKLEFSGLPSEKELREKLITRKKNKVNK
jgi:thiol-disulfide isomerase/thioredoxin